MKLHELSEDYKRLQDEDLPAEVIQDTLEAIEGEIQIKGENIALLVQNWDSDIQVLKEYKAKLDVKIKERQNRIEWLKNYLRGNMEATEIKKIECPLFTINCVVGREIVQIDDENAIPDEYVTVKVITTPDKKKLLEALKDGETILGASLTRSKSSIRIK